MLFIKKSDHIIIITQHNSKSIKHNVKKNQYLNIHINK